MCVVTGFARPVPGDWYEGGGQGQGVTQAAYRERPKRGFGRRWCESKSKKRVFFKLVLFQGLLKLWHAAQADVYLDF